MKEIKPEARVEILLWDWLRKNKIEVFFNRKNELNWQVFKIKGINKIPDLVIKNRR